MNENLNITSGAKKIRWQDVVARYASSDLRRSLWQVVNTLVPFFALWYLMIRSVEISYWLTLLLAISHRRVHGTLFYHLP